MTERRTKLVAHLCSLVGLSEAAAENALNALSAIMNDALNESKVFDMPGVGKLTRMPNGGSGGGEGGEPPSGPSGEQGPQSIRKTVDQKLTLSEIASGRLWGPTAEEESSKQELEVEEPQ